MQSEFHIHTKKYTLINDSTAIRAAESKAGLGHGIFQCEDPPSYTEVVTLIWALTRTSSPDLTLNQLFDVIQPGDYGTSLKAIKPFFGVEAFGMKALLEGSEAAGKPGDVPPLSAAS